jgi:peptide/nickel transport system permease protein
MNRSGISQESIDEATGPPAVESARASQDTCESLPRRLVWRRFIRHHGALTGLIIVSLIALTGIAAPIIFPDGHNQMRLTERLLPPGPGHWFGTDTFGRDLLVRLVYGSRVSLVVGVVSVAIGAGLGSVLGALAGYVGSWADNIIMRIMDAMCSFPAVLLAMALVSVLGTGLLNLMLAIGLVTVPSFARIVRSSVIQVRSREYVEAARAIGASDMRILWRHIIPNALSPLIVTASLQTASAILAASSLSFLGLGIQPPTPEWGAMLAESRGYMVRAPWLSICPGLAIAVTVMGFNLVGDGLRDALDPKDKGVS